MYIDVKYSFRPNPNVGQRWCDMSKRCIRFVKSSPSVGRRMSMVGRVLCDACCELADNMERRKYV